MRAGFAGLDAFMVKVDGVPWAPLPPGPDDPDAAPIAESVSVPDPVEGPVRWLEACQSPVWDTALAVTALLDAGVAPSDRSMLAAADWLLGEEIRVGGDWSVRRPRLAPGGWAFEFANDGYPDVDDTAEVVLALRRVAPGHPDPAAVHAAADRGADWVVGMASKDGGWAAFDADNTRELVRTLPFCDFGAVIDPPSADVTAHAVEMLAHTPGEPLDRGHRLAAHLAGEGRVLVRPLGRQPRVRHRRRGARAGRGRHPGRRAGDPAGRALAGGAPEPGRRLGRGPALVHGPAVGRARYVDRVADGVGAARADRGRVPVRGGRAWDRVPRPDPAVGRDLDEPQFTGTGFPGDFSINYHLYRIVFPLSALAGTRS